MSTRRFGSIRERGGTFTAIWSTCDPATGTRRQHSKSGFVRRNPARPPKGDSAQEFLDGIVAEVRKGDWRPDAKLTVGALMTNWLAAKKSEGLRPNTLAMYETVIEAWISHHIGGLPVAQLTPARAQQMVEALRSSDGSRLGRGSLSDRSVQLAVTHLKAATRWAFKTGQLSRDPLAGYDRPRARASSAATGAWTPEEAGKFLSAVSEDRLRALWWLLLSRGLRRGETAGLKWQAIDLERGQLRVVETRVVVKAKATSSTPKTDGSIRSVPLDARLIAELRAHRARQAEERLIAGSAWNHEDYLFVDELGTPYRPETLSRRFGRLVEDAKLRAIRFHDLRHTAASLMLAAGESPKVVAEILGHSSVVVTTTIYQHITPGMGKAAGERLTEQLAEHTV